jgi:hypothetical protein
MTKRFEFPFSKSKRFSCSSQSCQGQRAETLQPGRTGYLYISPLVVMMRADSLTLRELDDKLENLISSFGSQELGAIDDAFPRLICQECAKKLGLNLRVSLRDAKIWAKKSEVPLRPTPRIDSMGDLQ